MEIAIIISFSLIIYTFFGYPLLLNVFSKTFPRKIKKAPIEPSVTIVIPAHNEEKVIREKILNSLGLDYPSELLEIICASDGSEDRTVEIAKSLLPEERVLDISERQGKTNIINKATNVASGEIIVYTDANIILEKNALRELIFNFADPEVGCVAGQLTHVNVGETLTSASVGLYWRYEEYIKGKESETGSIMGADGGLFAIRRNLFTPLPLFIIDDYSTSMGILTRGHRVVFEPLAKAYELASTVAHDEFRRKVRIATRSVSASLYLAKGIAGLSFFNLFKFVSHRVMRYAAFYLMVLAYVLNLLTLLRPHLPILSVLFLIQTLFYLTGIAGLYLMNRKPRGILKFVRLISYFIAANATACYGASKACLVVACNSGKVLKVQDNPKTFN